MTAKGSKNRFFCVSMGAGLTYRMDMSCQGTQRSHLDRTCPCGTLVAAIAASETAATRLGAVIKGTKGFFHRSILIKKMHKVKIKTISL